jgi:hypothetical protein
MFSLAVAYLMVSLRRPISLTSLTNTREGYYNEARILVIGEYDLILREDPNCARLAMNQSEQPSVGYMC